jgi:hypothetical protein
VSEGTIRDALHFVLNNPAGAADEIERLRGLLREVVSGLADVEPKLEARILAALGATDQP